MSLKKKLTFRDVSLTLLPDNGITFIRSDWDMKSVVIFLAVGLTIAFAVAGYAFVDSEPDFLIYAGYIAATAVVPLILFVLVSLLFNLTAATGAMAAGARERREKARAEKEVVRAETKIKMEQLRAQQELARASMVSSAASLQPTLGSVHPHPASQNMPFPSTPEVSSGANAPAGYPMNSHAYPVSRSEMTGINTDYRIGFGPRIGAFSLDCVFLGLMTGVVSFFCITFFLGMLGAASEGGDLDDEMAAGTLLLTLGVWYFLLVVCSLIYWLTEVIWSGSPGKKILSLRIMRADGARPHIELWKRYLVKNAQAFIFICITMPLSVLALLLESDGLLFIANISSSLSGLAGLALFIGAFFIFNRNKQTLWDRLSGTIVIRH